MYVILRGSVQLRKVGNSEVYKALGDLAISTKYDGDNFGEQEVILELGAKNEGKSKSFLKTQLAMTLEKTFLLAVNWSLTFDIYQQTIGTHIHDII